MYMQNCIKLSKFEDIGYIINLVVSEANYHCTSIVVDLSKFCCLGIKLKEFR